MVRRLPLILILVGLLLAFGAAPTFAAIHPIVSAECASPNGSDVANGQNPVGQLPADEGAFFAGLVPATGSELRALIATGVILVDENGFFAGLDFSVSALNGNSGTEHCPNV